MVKAANVARSGKVHRRRLRDGDGARRRRRGEGGHRRRRRRRPPGRRARLGPRHSAAARRSRRILPKGAEGDSPQRTPRGHMPNRPVLASSPCPLVVDRRWRTRSSATPIATSRPSRRRARSRAAPKQAWLELAEFIQEQIDAIVDAMAAAATPQAEAFARLAVEETGYGVVADKIQKNLFASEKVYNFIRPMKTVGVIARHEDDARRRDRRTVRRRRRHRAVDQSDVHGHLQDPDRAQGALRRSSSARIRRRSAASRASPRSWTRRRAGPARRPAPINWMTTVTLEGTQELMKHRDVAVILATGGMGLVRAAYSAGKPAYGVGPGNAPALHRAHRGRAEGRPRHRHRQDVRQRRALLVGELGRRGRSRSPTR